MKAKYYPPAFGENKFNCPHCHVYAKQNRITLLYRGNDNRFYNNIPNDFLCITVCESCNRSSVWTNEVLTYPHHDILIMPHEDLPEELLQDYCEASKVFLISPKASAALVRLLLQKLLKYIGESGDNINDDIKRLVSKGVPEDIQRSLDICRLVGNNAVHPGRINIDDTPEMVKATFALINFIVEEMIARPNRIKALYGAMPEGALNAIEERDGEKEVS